VVGEQAWLGLTAFSVAFMVARVALGHLPDRLGGVRVAFFCMLIEATGLVLIWHASGFAAALVGVTITGFGYSLVYPGLGVEAIRLAPPQSRGVAMGTYTAFLDLALGLASPILGLFADMSGLSSVFLVSAGVVACTAMFGIRRLAVESRMPTSPSTAGA
jgi:predicted MFS family arabinose efflux permease